jgi:hypothetical protein
MRYTRFEDIPQFTREGSWECDYRLSNLLNTLAEWERDCGLNLEPDFQRAHVWTEEQQIAYVEFFLRGGKTSRVIYFNCPSWHSRVNKYDDFVIVDGKQRLRAFTRFLKDEIKVFGSLCSEFEDGLRLHHTVRINVNNLKTRAEVLNWYLQFNSGGTVHTTEELDRVRDLLDAEHLCTRKACRRPGSYSRHTQTGDLYCVPCARRINDANPGLVELKRSPRDERRLAKRGSK